MISKRRIIIISGAILGAILLWLFFSREKVALVEVVGVEHTNIQLTVSANGEIKSKESANLSFGTSGEIVRINVKESDIVESGQILAQLNAYSSQQTTQAAKDARDILLRDRDIFMDQYGNDKDAIGGETQYDIRLRRLNEQISQAEANYRAALGNHNDLYIRAPFKGTIVDVSKKPGEIATAGTPVIALADLDQLYFEVTLDQEDFGMIDIDKPAEIEFDAYPDKVFNGKVIKLPQFAKTSSGSEEFLIDLEVTPEEGYSILLGMTGEAKIIAEQTDGETQALPFDAIFESDDGTYFVWIIENSIIRKYPVDLGLEGDLFTEIKTSLDGKTVVIPSDSNTTIEDGVKAKIAS